MNNNCNKNIRARENPIPSGLYFNLAVIAALILATVFSSFGQAGYNKTFDLGLSIRFFAIKADGDKIYVAGYMTKSLTGHQSVFVASLDTLGEIMWLTEIEDDSSSLTISDESDILIDQNQNVILPYAYFDRSSIGLATISPGGVILIKQEYVQILGSVSSPRDVIEMSDGYLITGWISPPPDYHLDAFILKTDFDGKQKWMYTYGYAPFEEYARTITSVNDNEFVISGVRYSLDISSTFYHGWVLTIDSVGHTKWQWEANSNDIFNRGIMSMQLDTNRNEWVYASFLQRPTTYPGEDYLVKIPVLVRRDSAMNFLSHNEYGPYAINHYIGSLQPGFSGGWIACGSYTTTTDDYESPLKSQSGRILKISEEDSLIWSVIDTAFFHPVEGSSSYLSGVCESFSGSVYAVGWADNFDSNNVYRSYGWLVKSTKDGCIDTLCTTTSIDQEFVSNNTNHVKIYPNPATDYITIDMEFNLADDYYFELYNVNGQKVIRKYIDFGASIEDIDYLNPGFYYWKVINKNGKRLENGKLIIQ